MPNTNIADLSIFDVTGRRMRRLLSEKKEAGSHALRWDALDDQGDSMASGIYMVHFKSGDDVLTQKMLLIK